MLFEIYLNSGSADHSLSFGGNCLRFRFLKYFPLSSSINELNYSLFSSHLFYFSNSFFFHSSGIKKSHFCFVKINFSISKIFIWELYYLEGLNYRWGRKGLQHAISIHWSSATKQSYIGSDSTCYFVNAAKCNETIEYVYENSLEKSSRVKIQPEKKIRASAESTGCLELTKCQ